jgi:hypothetical protein
LLEVQSVTHTTFTEAESYPNLSWQARMGGLMASTNAFGRVSAAAMERPYRRTGANPCGFEGRPRAMVREGCVR